MLQLLFVSRNDAMALRAKPFVSRNDATALRVKPFASRNDATALRVKPFASRINPTVHQAQKNVASSRRCVKPFASPNDATALHVQPFASPINPTVHQAQKNVASSRRCAQPLAPRYDATALRVKPFASRINPTVHQAQKNVASSRRCVQPLASRNDATALRVKPFASRINLTVHQAQKNVASSRRCVQPFASRYDATALRVKPFASRNDATALRVQPFASPINPTMHQAQKIVASSRRCVQPLASRNDATTLRVKPFASPNNPTMHQAQKIVASSRRCVQPLASRNDATTQRVQQTLVSLCSHIILAALIFPALLQAQVEYPVSAISPELMVNAHVVVRVDETIFTIQSDGDAVLEETFVATILNEEGKYACSNGAQEDRFSKVKMLKGRLFDADGKLVRATKEEDVQEFGGGAEYEFTDNKSKYLRLEFPRFPYTVEFKKKTTMKGFWGMPSSTIQRLGASVENWQYTLIAPPSYLFKWKTPGLDLQPKQSVKGDKSIWEWQAQKLAAQPDEPYNPYFRDVTAQIQFAPLEINFDNHQGDFKSWNSVGRFFYELNNGRETLPPATVAQVQALTQGKTTREKIAALYKITQDNCRYVSIQLGIGGWQTFEAEFVDKKKYGDCKALSNYTQALLKAAGIEAWEASIYAGEDGAPEYDEAFPSPHFNHVILYVPSEDFWLECTSKTHPAGYLGAFTANRNALLFTPEGGKLVRTPVLRAADNFEKNHTKILLREDGSAEVQQQGILGGDRHDRCRHFALESTQEELEKSFTQNAPFSIAKLNNIKAAADFERPEASLEYQAETAKYATVSGKRMFVPLAKTNPVKRSLPANDKRVLDLKMTDAYTLCDTFSLQFPTGFEAENVPSGKKIESEFGFYEMTVEKFSDRVVVVRNVEIRPLQVPAARYGEVRQFLLDSAKADASQMVLVKKL